MPDEVSWLRAGRIEPRPLAVANTDALPLVAQEARARISKDGDTLEIAIEGEKAVTARLAEISQLVVYGNAYLKTPALHELMRREIPVSWHSHGGWFMGHTNGLSHRNVEIRARQWRNSFDDAFCLRFACVLHAVWWLRRYVMDELCSAETGEGLNHRNLCWMLSAVINRRR
jgi:CRISPR-associated protein Cas1